MLTERFRGKGLYILDEPEAALSPSRQMAMLNAPDWQDADQNRIQGMTLIDDRKKEADEAKRIEESE